MTALLPEGMYDRFRLRMQEVESRNGIETILGYRRVTAEDLRQRGWVPAAEVERLRATPSVMDWARIEGERDEARVEVERLTRVLTALVDDSEGQQHRLAWQDACEVLHGHRGPEVG